MRNLIRWMLPLAAALMVAHAAGVEPVDGVEVVVTDAAGHGLVGYGVVNNSLLILRMGKAPESFVLLLIGTDGAIQSFDGVKGAGGALLIDLPDGSRETLSSYMSQKNVAVQVVQAKATRVAGMPGTPVGSDGSSDGSSDGGSDGGSDGP